MSYTTKKIGMFGIDWSDVDLTDGYNRDQKIIDPLTFANLLLEVNCNLRDITPEAVMEQFETDLRARVKEARETMRDNLQNIVNYARKEREVI
jgi:hypothetical protein